MKPNDYQMIQQLRAQVDELLLLADPAAGHEAPHGTAEGIARPAWVMCFGTDEVDDARGLTLVPGIPKVTSREDARLA